MTLNRRLNSIFLTMEYLILKERYAGSDVEIFGMLLDVCTVSDQSCE